MKTLHITIHYVPVGLTPPPAPQVVEAVEFDWGKARGKIAVANSGGEITIYDNRAACELDLRRRGEIYVDDE